MASPGGHQDYDASLLASAPVATKAQLQGGYNPDLLIEKPVTPSSRHRDLEASTPVNDGRDAGTAYATKKQPFYRTTKGIIIIVVVLVVIIAAAVGGGVGGSRKKNHNETVAPTGPDSGGQDGGSPPPASGNSTSSSTSSGSGASQVVGAPDPNASRSTTTSGGANALPTEPPATNGVGQLVNGSS